MAMQLPEAGGSTRGCEASILLWFNYCL